MLAFFSSLSISDGLSPATSSCCSRSISSSDIRARRWLFSTSILCLSMSSTVDTFLESGLVSEAVCADLPFKVGEEASEAVASRSPVPYEDTCPCVPLCCLKAEILERFLCAGKPVSEVLLLGAVGGFGVDEGERSLTSLMNPRLEQATEEALPSTRAISSSSEDRSM